MIDPQLLKTAGELGVPTVLLLAFLVSGIVGIPKILAWYTAEAKRRDDAIASMQASMIAVVSNNTAAITKLCDTSSQTATSLQEHDERAQRIEGTVTQIARVTDRTEAKVDAIKAELATVRKP